MSTNNKFLIDLVKQNTKSKKFTNLVDAVRYVRTLIPKVDTKSYISLPKIRTD